MKTRTGRDKIGKRKEGRRGTAVLPVMKIPIRKIVGGEGGDLLKENHPRWKEDKTDQGKGKLKKAPGLETFLIMRKGGINGMIAGDVATAHLGKSVTGAGGIAGDRKDQERRKPILDLSPETRVMTSLRTNRKKEGDVTIVHQLKMKISAERNLIQI